MRVVGPETLIAATGLAGVVEHRARHAADADLVLLGVERVAAGADAREVVLQRRDRDERARRQPLERLAARVQRGRRRPAGRRP